MELTVPGPARIFLLICATGLVPIAFSYGVSPAISLDAMYGITAEGTNLTHIMRAVMGLYLGMVLIWVAGAITPKLCGPALVSCAVFMLGLAFGRVLSFVMDGFPHWLLILYFFLEVVLGITAVVLFRKLQTKGI